MNPQNALNFQCTTYDFGGKPVNLPSLSLPPLRLAPVGQPKGDELTPVQSTLPTAPVAPQILVTSEFMMQSTHGAQEKVEIKQMFSCKVVFESDTNALVVSRHNRKDVGIWTLIDINPSLLFDGQEILGELLFVNSAGSFRAKKDGPKKLRFWPVALTITPAANP